MPALAVDREHRVTPRELFFDLVFVFGFTQVASLLAGDPTWAGVGRGILVLAALWWAWAAYAWLTNVVDPEDGVVGAALLVAHVGDELDSVAAAALCGGSALYLLTFSAIRTRVERRLRFSRGRFAAAAAMLLVLPVATRVPALAALTLVATIWLSLHVYELVWWRDARAESRSVLAS